MKKILRKCMLFFLLVIISANGYSSNGKKPLIFPLPSELQLAEGTFDIDKSAFIITPEKGSDQDRFLSGLFASEIADRYEQNISIARTNSYAGKNKFILIGNISNPLVKQFCEQNNLVSELKKLGQEGYILTVTPDKAVVAANTDKGALYGLESLRQLISRKDGRISIPGIVVKDRPRFGFRGIKLYLPGRENITFFKRFIKDFAALYKFNKIILELNANMRFERHPELNSWPGRRRPPGRSPPRSDAAARCGCHDRCTSARRRQKDTVPVSFAPDFDRIAAW
jgi:hexosaminidase